MEPAMAVGDPGLIAALSAAIGALVLYFNRDRLDLMPETMMEKDSPDRSQSTLARTLEENPEIDNNDKTVLITKVDQSKAGMLAKSDKNQPAPKSFMNVLGETMTNADSQSNLTGLRMKYVDCFSGPRIKFDMALAILHDNAEAGRKNSGSANAGAAITIASTAYRRAAEAQYCQLEKTDIENPSDMLEEFNDSEK